MARKKRPLLVRKNQMVRMEFADSYLQKGSEFWKTVLFGDETNIMYLDKTDVIACGEILGKNFGKKSSPVMMVP